MKGKEVKESIEDIVAYGRRLNSSPKASKSNMPYELNEYVDYLKEQGFTLFWQSFGNRGDCIQYWERKKLLSGAEYIEINIHPDTPILFLVCQVQKGEWSLNYGRRHIQG